MTSILAIALTVFFVIALLIIFVVATLDGPLLALVLILLGVFVVLPVALASIDAMQKLSEKRIDAGYNDEVVRLPRNDRHVVMIEAPPRQRQERSNALMVRSEDLRRQPVEHERNNR